MRCVAWVLVAACATNAWGSGLVFELEYRNLGRIEAAGDLVEEFPFKVTGQGPVEILDVQASCGCIQPSISKRIYAPGDRDKLIFGIHATSQAEGKKRHQVTLTYRQAGEVVSLPIILDLELYKPIVVEPSNLLLYVQGDRPIRQVLTVTDKRPLPLDIRGVSTSSARLHPRLLETPGADPAIRRVELVVEGDFPPGKSEEQLMIRTADARHADLVVPVTVVRSSRLRVLPEELHAKVGGARAPSWLVLISDTKGEAIEIDSATCTLPGIRIDAPREATSRCRLRVSVDERSVHPFEGEVEIHVAKPIPAVLRLPIRLD